MIGFGSSIMMTMTMMVLMVLSVGLEGGRRILRCGMCRVGGILVSETKTASSSVDKMI